jgi:D-galactarolactone cycloisomerase
MKISRIRALPLFASFADAFGGSHRVPPSLLAPSSQFRQIPRLGQYSTLVVVETDDGLSGIGECYGLPYPFSAASLVVGVAAPLLHGKDISDAASIMDQIRVYFLAQGNSRGPAMEALSGLDIALFDLKARLADLPLHTLLGAKARPIKTYVSPIPLSENPAASAAKAAAFVEQGFSAVKLKIGRDLATDIEHVEAVRDAVGTNIGIMVDANRAYELGPAIDLARHLQRLNVIWFEEPIRSDDPDDLAEMRRRSPVPIAGGEGEFTVERIEMLLRKHALDVVQPNITRAGGITGLLAIAELCQQHGAQFSPHGVGSAFGVAAALHVCCAAATFETYEANQLTNPLRDQLVTTPLRIESGWYLLPSGIGLGLTPNWDNVRRYGMPTPRFG